LICDLVKFYEGGLSFDHAERMAFSKLRRLSIEAGKINDRIKKEMEK